LLIRVIQFNSEKGVVPNTRDSFSKGGGAKFPSTRNFKSLSFLKIGAPKAKIPNP
jgi:hypothetical protein